MSNPENTATLEDVKKYLRKNYMAGCKCPACGQNVKLYKRNLNSSMAYAIIIIARYKKVKEPFHLEEFFKANATLHTLRGDAPKLRHWGLIERGDDNPKPDGNPRDGMYFLTDLGLAFVKGLVRVRKCTYSYNNVQVEVKDEEGLVSIQDCINDKFNYSEVMGPLLR